MKKKKKSEKLRSEWGAEQEWKWLLIGQKLVSHDLTRLSLNLTSRGAEVREKRRPVTKRLPNVGKKCGALRRVRLREHEFK